MAEVPALELTEPCSVHVMPGGGWRVEWSALWGPWRLRGEARTEDGRFVLTRLHIQLESPGWHAPDGEWVTDDSGQPTWEPAENTAAFLAAEDGGKAPAYPPGAITSRVVQRLPVGRLLDLIRAYIIKDRDLEPFAEGLGFTFAATEKRGRRARAEEVSKPRALGRGRPQLADEYLIEVARLRLRLQRDGFSLGIHAEMANHFQCVEKTMKNHLRLARERGFLDETTRGSRGALPGPLLPRTKGEE